MTFLILIKLDLILYLATPHLKNMQRFYKLSRKNERNIRIIFLKSTVIK